MLRKILDNQTTTFLISLTIFLNAAVMALEHHDQSQQLTNFIEMTNLIFTIVYLVEIVLEFYAVGFYDFIAEGFNVLDTVIIIIK